MERRLLTIRRQTEGLSRIADDDVANNATADAKEAAAAVTAATHLTHEMIHLILAWRTIQLTYTERKHVHRCGYGAICPYASTIELRLRWERVIHSYSLVSGAFIGIFHWFVSSWLRLVSWQRWFLLTGLSLSMVFLLFWLFFFFLSGNADFFSIPRYEKTLVPHRLLFWQNIVSYWCS